MFLSDVPDLLHKAGVRGGVIVGTEEGHLPWCVRLLSVPWRDSYHLQEKKTDGGQMGTLALHMDLRAD